MRNPFIGAALTKQRRKSLRMCWRGGGSGFEDDTERCEGDARRVGLTWIHWCSCQWPLPELLLCLGTSTGMNSGSSMCGSWAKPPNSPIPSGSRVLLVQNCSGTETFEAFPSCLVKASPPESPVGLGTHRVGSRQSMRRCYYRNRAKHLTPEEQEAALAILKWLQQTR